MPGVISIFTILWRFFFNYSNNILVLAEVLKNVSGKVTTCVCTCVCVCVCERERERERDVYSFNEMRLTLSTLGILDFFFFTPERKFNVHLHFIWILAVCIFNMEPRLENIARGRDRKDFPRLSSPPAIATWTLHQHPDIIGKGQQLLFSNFLILSIYSTEIK